MNFGKNQISRNFKNWNNFNKKIIFLNNNQIVEFVLKLLPKQTYTFSKIIDFFDQNQKFLSKIKFCDTNEHFLQN